MTVLSHKARPVLLAVVAISVAGVLAACTSSALPQYASIRHTPTVPYQKTAVTFTPIKHLVVIYDENISFDHYFGTYPNAANTDGTTFTAAAGTPTPVNLLQNDLLKKNPNEFQPFRLTPSHAVTCDQNHSVGPEEAAANGGKNDKAVQYTSSDSCGIGGAYSTVGMTMGYYDGNTVTGLWNYAQHYSLNDNSYSSTFGPSTLGALNLAAAQTHGMKAVSPKSGKTVTGSQFVSSVNSSGVGTDTGDADPYYDDCSGNDRTSSVDMGEMTGKNIGDLLNTGGITWGWFQAGFAPNKAYNASAGTLAKCTTTHKNIKGVSSTDYVPHHNPFAYYASTSNPHHLPPTSTATIGKTDQANHNYDLTDFSAALTAGNLPSVSFLKGAAYENGHAANSDPIDEQHFLVSEINAIEQSKFWSSTAIVVAYDDSDGWYDQRSATLLNGSNDKHIANSVIDDQPMCVNAAKSSSVGVLGGYADRCGPGTRQPLLVISPYAKSNYIDDTATEQASITAFIEDNWKLHRLGDAAFDARAGTLDNMFNFKATTGSTVILKPDGEVASVNSVTLTPQ